MLEVDRSLADLIRVVQDANQDDVGVVLAALIHLLLSNDDGVALAA